MPGIRKPANVLELSGALRKNPKRYRSRKNPSDSRPIGRCPSGLTAEQRRAWRDIVAADPGALCAADRATVELAARLLAESRTNPDMLTSRMAVLATTLHRLGQSPVGRNYVNVPAPKEGSLFDEF